VVCFGGFFFELQMQVLLVDFIVRYLARMEVSARQGLRKQLLELCLEASLALGCSLAA